MMAVLESSATPILLGRIIRAVRAVLAIVCLLQTIDSLHSAIYSPRVLSPQNADTYSLKTFAQFHPWRELDGDAKAYAIFRYLTDRRTGLYPLGAPAWEGGEELAEYGAVTDPIKMLNVYPIGHCGTLGPTMAGIMEGMGVGPARTLVIPAWNHVASEAFYGRQWHYLDLDVRAVFRRPNGSLASIAEAQRDPSLWNRANSPEFFPLDPIDHVRQVYARTKVEHRYGMGTGGHTMDYLLRQGETFMRWWKPQGGRWNHHSSYAARPFPRSVIEQEPRGPKCKHPSFTMHTHGNGRFVYRPNLSAGSSDFADGVYDYQNVELTKSGLTLKGASRGYAIFEVRTPYVIVPLVGDLDSNEDDREASVVTIEAAGATLALSLDNGLIWQKLGHANGTFDLTRHVSGTYGYLLKIELQGKAGDANVRSLEITTWVQVHPASLPSLQRGNNRMRLVSLDHYGLPTRVMEIRPSAANPEELLKYLIEPPKDYVASRRSSRIQGTFVARAEAPPRTKIAWFSAGASFTARLGNLASNTRNVMAYAVNEPAQFKQFYRSDVPGDQSHWHYNAEREIVLEEPARAVYVRYTGDPAVNNIRIFAHCSDDLVRPSSLVRITHAWTENGARKSKQVQIEAGAEYEILCEGEPEDGSIELSVPSVIR